VAVSPGGELEDDAVADLAAADVVYLCRPNNPSGALLSRARVETVLERARGLVLIDEAYGEYAGESLLDLALDSGRAVVLRTFSKAYGLAALRVGYALGPGPLVRVIELSRGPYKVNAVAERAAAAAMADGGPWLRDLVERTVETRDRLAASLRARGLRVYDSAANFLLAGVPEGSAGALKAGLAERGVGVRAFDRFGPGEDALRVTVGPWSDMVRFLEALDDVLAVGAVRVDPDPRDLP
jgi:histidinol-phosphate aminotransferase